MLVEILTICGIALFLYGVIKVYMIFVFGRLMNRYRMQHIAQELGGTYTCHCWYDKDYAEYRSLKQQRP